MTCEFRRVRNHIFIDNGDLTLCDIVLYDLMSRKPLYELHLKSNSRIEGVDDI
jgi:hypothetical protein